MSSSSVISRAEEFFYFEDDLSSSLENWASTRCESFGRYSEKDEHPLEHQQEYQYYFEDVMHAFLTNEGFSVSDFYTAIQSELESMPAAKSDETFASVLMSALDFDTFCVMMNDVKEGRGVVFCPPLVSLESDFYGEQEEETLDAYMYNKTADSKLRDEDEDMMREMMDMQSADSKDEGKMTIDDGNPKGLGNRYHSHK